MNIKFCLNSRCGGPLGGKQRSYCSDKCRKAYKRQLEADNSRTNGQQNSSSSAINKHPVNVFSLYADVLSDLSVVGMGQIKLHLVTQAEYADVCLSRLTNCQHDIHIGDKIVAQQALCAILWKLVDDIQEVERSLEEVTRVPQGI